MSTAASKNNGLSKKVKKEKHNKSVRTKIEAGKRKNKGRKYATTKPETRLINTDSIMTPQQLKRDARRQTPQTQLIDLKNQQKQIEILVPLPSASLQGICLSYILLAMQRGYAAFAPNPAYPFWAYVFMFKVLRAYAGEQEPPVVNMPYWLLCVCHAIAPKIVPFQQGYASYAFNLDSPNYSPSTDAYNVPVGYSPYGFVATLQYPTSEVQVNGFPTSANANLNYQSDKEGADAFANIIGFMRQQEQALKGDKKGPSDIVSVGETKTRYQSSVSAFAAVSGTEGLGYYSCGGYAGNAQLEVPILDPMFAIFTISNANAVATQNRFYNSSTTVSGDGMWLAVYMSTLSPVVQYKARRFPRFHSVDFLEFGDVLAQWVVGLINSYLQDPEVVTNIQANGHNEFLMVEPSPAMGRKIPAVKAVNTWPLPGLNDPTCPLSLQDMLLCLRSVIMAAFKETQVGVQSILPRVPSSGNDNEFTPYVAGANCCPMAALSMQLPMALIENIRALVARKVTISEPKDVQWYVPILGQYCKDTLQSANYVANLHYPFNSPPNDIIPFAVFNQNPSYEKSVVDAKSGKVSVVLRAEEEISLIDGQSGDKYVWINNPARLQQLITLWNKWLSTMNMSSYSMTLGTFGTELGISTLTAIATTRHWIPAPLDQQPKTKEVRDIRIEKDKELTDTIYAGKQSIAVSSQGVILAAPYEQVLSVWVLPTNKSESGSNSGSQTVFTRYQEMLGEPFAVATTSGEDGVLKSFTHSVYANKMLKGKLAEKNDWDNFLIEESAKGRGGILAGIGGALDSLLGGI